MEYIDGITIIDTSGTILFSVKSNPCWKKNVAETIVGKRFLDVFTDLTPATSTLFRCMEEGRPIQYVQTLHNAFSGQTEIEGVSYPIQIDGTIVGAVEVSRERRENILPEEKQEGKTEGDTEEKTARKAEAIGASFEEGIRRLLSRGTGIFANRARYSLDDIICQNKRMKSQVEYAGKIAASSSPVLIIGPTGTGKELFAHGIHEASDRREKPFVVQNCSAIPDTLLESILFGTCKGSFTGAADRKGIFEAADGGTLFLDEIHAMPLHLQAKLLRVLQDGYVRRVGAEKEYKIDVRVIAATNVDLAEAANGQKIRQDLFYRLAVLTIQIPPLKERKEDLALLTQYFIRKNSLILGKQAQGMDPEVYRFLQDYDWPGNVRELENVIEAAMNVLPAEKQLITMDELPDSFLEREKAFVPRSLKETLEETELGMLRDALHHFHWNVSEAARALGLPRQTLQQKMKKYDLKKKM